MRLTYLRGLQGTLENLSLRLITREVITRIERLESL